MVKSSFTVVLIFLAAFCGLAKVGADSTIYAGKNCCLKLDGMNDRISCTSEVYRTYDFTFEVWIRPLHAIENGSDALYGHEIGVVASLSETWVNGWVLYFDYSEGRLRFRYRESLYGARTRDVIASTLTYWDPDSWYHIAVVHDCSTHLSFYVNRTADMTYVKDIYNISHETANLRIGCNATGAMFGGFIDEVRIWKIPRLHSEIADCWDRVLNLTERAQTSLIGYWRFDDENKSDARDWSLQGNKAILGLGENCPEWVGDGAPISRIPLFSDINEDGIVNILDLSIGARAFGSKPGDPHWNEKADLDRNFTINIVDLAAVAKDWGKEA